MADVFKIVIVSKRGRSYVFPDERQNTFCGKILIKSIHDFFCVDDKLYFEKDGEKIFIQDSTTYEEFMKMAGDSNTLILKM